MKETKMFNEVVKTITWAGQELELSTGKFARQADGAVMVKMGGTVLLCNSVSSKIAKADASFFPLTVHYKEMAFAAGKIPGGFFKREGKPSEKEVLTSRLIDRPIRPLFHSGFFNETQVVCTVLSHDPASANDILAIIGASAALALSGVPFLEIIAAARVGLINDEFILNPSFEQTKESNLDLVIAGTKESIMLVESEANLLSEDTMLKALKFAHEAFKPVIKMIEELVAIAGKPKWEVKEFYPKELEDEIAKMKHQEVIEAFKISSKQLRSHALEQMYNSLVGYFSVDHVYTPLQIKEAFEKVKANVLRHDVIVNHIRIDKRTPIQIRPIECEVAFLPQVHGSALFTRGETQTLTTVTLGTSQDEQMIDSLDGEYKERFLLNYNFPPYSVGEATPMRPPGRREIGHGKLAWRAINPVLPSKQEFPYTLRVVTEVTESNGSSSMATVCGASMALMDAGVPLKGPIAGIAMGLIMEKDKYVVLSDIIADEDYLGDMDFKVAGNEQGITALQMDIKVKGITHEIMASALKQSTQGILHILGKMRLAIEASKTEISPYAPVIESFLIDKNKIREVIGPGGKVIREICETTGAKIDIAEDGTVSVSAVGRDKLELAIARIKEITFNVEVGGIFDGTVVKILESGAFINYYGNKDGFIHISEISDTKIATVSDELSVNAVVKVKIIGFDIKGKAKLSMKNLDNKAAAPAAVSKVVKEEESNGNTDSDAGNTNNNNSNNSNNSNTNNTNKTTDFKRKREPIKDSASKERKYFN